MVEYGYAESDEDMPDLPWEDVPPVESVPQVQSDLQEDAGTSGANVVPHNRQAEGVPDRREPSGGCREDPGVVV